MMDPLLGWLLETSWNGSVAALVVLVATAVIARWPLRWVSYVLWAGALVRFLIPGGVETLVSALRLGPPLATAAGELLPGLGGEAIAGAASDPVRAADWDALILILAAIWIAGVMVRLRRLLAAWLACRRLLRRARPLVDPALEILLTECRRAADVRKEIRLAESADVSTPALAGWWRPVILVPSGLPLGEERFRHVCLHELAHLRLLHGPVRWLAAVVRALHWFNPLVHFAWRRLEAEAELAADAAVMARLARGERRRYGLTLLEVATSAPTSRPDVLVGFSSSSRRQLERRLAMIGSFRLPSLPLRSAAIAAAALIAAVAFTEAPDPAAAAARARDDGYIDSGYIAPGYFEEEEGTPESAEPAGPAGEGPLRQTADTVRQAGVAMYYWVTDRFGEQADAGASPDGFQWDRCPRIDHAALSKLVVPAYLEELPKSDFWGTTLQFCLDTTPSRGSYNVMGVRSAGSDRRFATTPYAAGAFDSEDTAQDIVWMDGYFVRWPQKQTS